MKNNKFKYLKKEWDIVKSEYTEKELRFFIEKLIWPQCFWAEEEIRERRIKENKGAKEHDKRGI